ncbi:hypothetical protein P4S63_13350 [Pseudoalteromonas sp. B193]
MQCKIQQQQVAILFILPPHLLLPTPDTCTGGADTNNTDHLVVQINTQRSDITFSALDSNANIFTQISFDPLGKSNQTCTSQCRIDVGLAGVCISGEGLIYACP